LAQHVGSTMEHMTLDGIQIELQKMVGLSQRLMHAVNFRGDEGYILPRHPLSFSSGASTSASYQAPSSSTRAPFPPSSSTRPSFAPTASAPYLSQLSAFYAIGTCFFFLVIFFRDTMTSFLSMTNIYFYRETTDTYRTGGLRRGQELHLFSSQCLSHLLRKTTTLETHHHWSFSWTTCSATLPTRSMVHS
jgi:hypothetical protein